LNTAFLEEPVSTWSNIPDYITLSNFVRNVPVVNNECERLCKRTSDYASKNGKTEEDFFATLQCVDSAIKQLPSRKLKKDIVRAFDTT
jgi:hypothetical protein